MNRSFIEVPTFTAKWRELGLTDEDLRELQKVLLQNPKKGDSICIFRSNGKLIPLEAG